MQSKASKQQKLPRIAVLVDTSTTWGQGVIKGVHGYGRDRGWQLYFEASGMEQHSGLPTGWQGDGVIARIGYPKLAAELRAARLPVVNVSGIELEGCPFPRVTSEQTVLVNLAVQHFCERGFHSFAYFGVWGRTYVARQQGLFAEALRTHGYDCASYSVKPHLGAAPDWKLDLQQVGVWLRGLPQPVGILTWNADSARDLLYACQVAGLLVPEQVAVLSGCDDDLLCVVAHIPLSAIRVAAEQIGYRAAVMLDGLLHGRRMPRTEELVPPLGVVTRQSTDTLAIHDPLLVKAVAFIRENACRGARVPAVARHAGVSRSVLDQRFEKLLHRTPAEEIRRIQLERACELLAGSMLPLIEVAVSAGFCSPEHLARVFRTVFNQTPRQYRAHTQGMLEVNGGVSKAWERIG
ncbi:MAG: DNA-binding transcriptional regulator [Kiritimatiellaeota bacterium]|nr:DNA-binding transcriptional regulator [Kiritimatiellota bacterium]